MDHGLIRATAPVPAGGQQRLRHRITGEYLHLSGSGTTPSLRYAWLGSQRHADTLKARALARGESWPFVAISRAVVDHTPEEYDWKGTA